MTNEEVTPGGPDPKTGQNAGQKSDQKPESSLNGASENSESPPQSNGSALETKITELEQQLKDEKNKYLYLYADFDNFKKRSIKERSDLIRFGWEGVARELVGVMENLERAVEHMPPNVDENLKTGIEMVQNHFKTTLSKQGVSEVPAVGTVFNPEFHEAMGQEPSDQPEGTITQALTKGYTLHGRLLRPARVVVSTGKRAEAPTGQG